jgi:hypothetical protein
MRCAVSKRACQQLITNPFLGNLSVSRSIEEMFLLKWISLFLPWEIKAKYFVPKVSVRTVTSIWKIRLQYWTGYVCPS